MVVVENDSEEITINCTTTNSNDTITFSGGPSSLMERHPPIGKVWTFPAIANFTGQYFCICLHGCSTVQSTAIIVYPTAGLSYYYYVVFDYVYSTH